MSKLILQGYCTCDKSKMHEIEFPSRRRGRICFSRGGMLDYRCPDCGKPFDNAIFVLRMRSGDYLFPEAIPGLVERLEAVETALGTVSSILSNFNKA